MTGPPGTGKSSLLIDIAVARLTDPAVDSESVLLLTSDRRAATRMREEITARVLQVDAAGGPPPHSTREPLVRTVHSYAFAVLRLQAAAEGNPPPRLITGSEQDAILRELLAGDVADGAPTWPDRLRPALGTDGFAQALRDVIMRAAERGVGPDQLVELGRRHGRDEWVAAGVAYRQYEQTTLLRGSVGATAPTASAPAVDAAELIGAALGALSTDDDLVMRERARIRHLLVDDAQHLDPQAAQLIRMIGSGTDETVIAGDRDQRIFGFRGATSAFLDDLPVDASRQHPGVDVTLTRNQRSSPSIATVGAQIAARLPGPRSADASPDSPDGPDSPVDSRTAVAVAAYSSAAKEAAAIADTFRRAHLFDGIGWSRMAIVVRSVPRAVAPLRRALRAAGVPLRTPATEIPLHRQRAVDALLSVLRATGGDVTADEAVALLTGPIGGADPTAVRRLRRGIRRVVDSRPTGAAPVLVADGPSVDLLAALMTADRGWIAPFVEALTPTERQPLQRVSKVITTARARREAGAGVEDVLWAAWQATNLDRRWAAIALRGGPAADQADRDLDAVVELFDVAAGFTDNLPAAGVDQFVDHVEALRIPGETRRRSDRLDAVEIVSAHSAAGREWDVVAVAGVLDGLWPALRSRGGVLATPALVDLLDGVPAEGLDTVSRTAAALADERRLFLVACTRARRRLMVTAVDDGSGDAAPSRFVVELAAGQSRSLDPAAMPASADGVLPVTPAARRVLSLPSVVAALRARVCVSALDAHATRASELLARLAEAGVPGAHPDEWFGLAEPSTDAALWSPGRGPVTVSPSGIDALHGCALRWLFEKSGGRDGDSAPAVAGTLVHVLVQAIAGRVAPEEVTAALRRVWGQVDVGAPWFSAHELVRAEQMLEHFGHWLQRSRSDLEEVAVEVDVDAVLPGSGPIDGAVTDVSLAESLIDGTTPVRLAGRIDRLERDRSGRPVVIDVKTGKSMVSKSDAASHPQLAAYQLALHLGGVAAVVGAEPGGGRLVYVNSSNTTTGAAERTQPPLSSEQVGEWIALVRAAAAASVGPRFVATVNDGCVRCPVRSSCPAQIAGKAVTDE